MRVLVTGAAGQVGQALLQTTPEQVQLRALTRAQLDIADRSAVQAEVSGFAPEVIINAAAYTAVDRAEAEPALAAAVNVAGPRHLAEAAMAIPGCRLLHLSTDYVFDGRSAQAYRPLDPTHPLGVYGATKLDGERAVQEILAERCAIVRTAWVYAASGRNFLLTMLRAMAQRRAVRVVADQIGTPSAAVPFAQLLWRLGELGAERVHGVFHWTDAGVASWYDFAVAIAEEGAARELLPADVQVTPITSAQYPTAATRPTFSLLETSRAREVSGLQSRHWRVRLRETLDALQRSADA